jgi:hypothetical protein
MERDVDAVDMQIMLFICANGIPINGLRSPQYFAMVAAHPKCTKGIQTLLPMRRHGLPFSMHAKERWRLT